MTSAAILAALEPAALRGRLLPDHPLADLTWFRVGGPADVLFTPADEDDLAAALAALPPEVPVTVIGLGSNLIVRDGGVPGLVIRLGGKAFGSIHVEGETIRAGTAVPDMKLARAAAEAGLDGLAFYRGIPGSVDGAGTLHVLAHAEMGFAYRHCSAPADLIFTQATYRGRPGDRAAIEAEMDRVTAAREAAQPIRERTGGSTFKNPDGGKAWQLVDAAGCRGLTRGGAQVSEMHCNFLINRGGASAADIEGLGEEVRARVRETSGVELHWEIKRIGVAAR
jgi:UDP-N-acetylmuramate dehydrogenase